VFISLIGRKSDENTMNFFSLIWADSKKVYFFVNYSMIMINDSKVIECSKCQFKHFMTKMQILTFELH